MKLLKAVTLVAAAAIFAVGCATSPPNRHMTGVHPVYQNGVNEAATIAAFGGIIAGLVVIDYYWDLRAGQKKAVRTERGQQGSSSTTGGN